MLGGRWSARFALGVVGIVLCALGVTSQAAPAPEAADGAFRVGLPLLAADGTLANPRSGADPRFGLQMGLGGYGPGGRTKRIADVQGTHTGIMRANIFWPCTPATNCIETGEGAFDWTVADNAVSYVEPTGVPVLMNLAGFTCVNGHPNPLYKDDPPRKLAAYAAFVRAAVRRYEGLVVAWQIETEIQYEQNWCGSMPLYGSVLRTAYETIKSEAPGAPVLLAGLGLGQLEQADIGPNGPVSPGGKQILDQIRAQRDAAMGSFDVLDLHIYHQPEAMPARIAYFKQLFAATGFRGETWITETGGPHPRWDCPMGVLSAPGPELQAANVLKRYALGLAGGADRLFWQALSGLDPGPWSCDPASPQFSTHSFMNLIWMQNDRPALLTYGLVTEKLAGYLWATIVRQDNAFVVEFVTPRGAVLIAWSASGALHRFPSTPVRITRWDGTTTTPASASVQLGAEPLVIELGP